MGSCGTVFEVNSFPRIAPMKKLAAQWNAVADLVLDDESSQWRSKAVRLVAQAEPRGGDRETMYRSSVPHDFKSLVMHADPHESGGPVVRRSDATGEKDR